MKNYKAFGVLTVLSLGSAVGVEGASEIKEDRAWSETYKVNTQAPQLEISNIWGDVKVRPGSDDEIVVSIREVRSAPSQKLFERSQDLIKLNVDVTDERVTMEVGDPEKRWTGKNRCNGCRAEFQFDILVPADSVIDVSTVNDGKIDVSGISGLVSASNVNGPVTIRNMQNCDEINTVNGPISITYLTAPTTDCEFNTINGDVNLTVPQRTNLNVSVDLFNGEVTSELPVTPFAQPANVERVTKNGSQKFLIKKKSGFSIGSNGPVYSIASMNGDVRIKKYQ